MKFYRRKKGISQAQLAEACDVSNGTIGNIECGVTKPSFDLIIKIAEKLNIKHESLFFSSESSIKHDKAEFSDKLTKEQLKRIKETFSAAMSNALDELKE